MHRGCSTDPTEIRLLCEKNDALCMKCSESGCNNQPKHKAPEIACIHCNDTKECAFGHDKQKSVQCKTLVQFPEVESCFTHSLNRMNIVRRGCTLDTFKENSHWCNEPNNNCQICHESGCNIENVQHHCCYTCESDENGECAVVKNSHFEECNGAPYSYSNRGCFTIKKSISI